MSYSGQRGSSYGSQPRNRGRTASHRKRKNKPQEKVVVIDENKKYAGLGGKTTIIKLPPETTEIKTQNASGFKVTCGNIGVGKENAETTKAKFAENKTHD